LGKNNNLEIQSKMPYTVVNNVISLRTLIMPVSVVNFVAANFDPSTVKFIAGEIVLTTSSSARDATIEDLCKFRENLPGDIILWASTPRPMRSKFFSYIENAPLPSSTEISVNEVYSLNRMGCVMMMYLLHGTLAGLNSESPALPLFAINACDLSAADFIPSVITSSVGFYKGKFHELLTHFRTIAPVIPDTMKSRFTLGMTGNRIFSITKIIVSIAPGVVSESDTIEMVADPDVMAGVPYISFHPDYPNNPMKNATRKYWATLGTAFKKHNGNLSELKPLSSGLFLQGVINAMDLDPSLVSGVDIPPDMFAQAVQQIFSIPAIIGPGSSSA